MTNRSYRFVGVASLIGLIGIVAIAWALGWLPAILTGDRAEAGFPQDADVLCGPRALYHASLLLGIPADPQSIVDQFQIGPMGVDLLQLKHVAESLGLTAIGNQYATWEDLREWNGVAILFIRNNHFICVDTRDSPLDRSPRVRVYDHARPEWWDQQELEQSWGGKTLFINRSDDRFGANHSPLRFERLLHHLDHAEGEGLDRQLIYRLVNQGDRPIQIIDVRTNCGCAHAEAIPSVIRPNEKGKIVLHLDLRDRNGFFETSAVITTDDPVLPQVLLHVRGDALDTTPVIPRHIDLGSLKPGQSSRQSIVLQRRGETDFHIQSHSLVLRDHSGNPFSPDTLKIAASWEPWDDTDQTTYGQPGDLKVTVTTTPSESCPPGSFTGELTLVLTGVTSTDPLVIPLSGRVDPRIRAQPPVLVILASKTPDGSPLTREVNFTSTDDASVESVDVGDLPLQSEIAASGQKVTFVLDPSLLPDAPMSGDIRCKFDSGSTVLIPCQIFIQDMASEPESSPETQTHE